MTEDGPVDEAAAFSAEAEAVQGNAANWAVGRAALDAAYGAGFSDRYPPREEVKPFSRHTVETLFAQVWTRPGLPMRDRRLLVLGAVAMLGRPDLVQTQVLGGLRGGDFTKTELREAELQLAFYVGWPNGTALSQGVDAALAQFAAESGSESESGSQPGTEG